MRMGDNLQEEVQTDPVETREMWTQKPPAAVDLKGLVRNSRELLLRGYTVPGQMAVPRFGEFCCCCCLPLLP